METGWSSVLMPRLETGDGQVGRRVIMAMYEPAISRNGEIDVAQVDCDYAMCLAQVRRLAAAIVADASGGIEAVDTSDARMRPGPDVEQLNGEIERLCHIGQVLMAAQQS